MQIIDFAYRPATIDARVGDSVVFANDGRAPHTATSRDGSIDTGTIAAGGRRSVRLPTAGTFSIFCTFHPEMTATVRVADSTGAAPATEAVAETETTADAASPGGSGPDGRPAQDADVDDTGEPAEVQVLDFRFAPAQVEVAPGDSVTWTFAGDAPHTVTAVDDEFDSGILESGATFSFTFEEVGTHRYVCDLHPQMTGRVLVVEPAPDGGEAALGAVVQARTGPSPQGGDPDLGLALLGGAAILGGTALLLMAARRFILTVD